MKTKDGTVKFAAFSREDSETVRRIVERAAAMFARFGVDVDRMSLRMDIAATHAGGAR